MQNVFFWFWEAQNGNLYCILRILYIACKLCNGDSDSEFNSVAFKYTLTTKSLRLMPLSDPHTNQDLRVYLKKNFGRLQIT